MHRLSDCNMTVERKGLSRLSINLAILLANIRSVLVLLSGSRHAVPAEWWSVTEGVALKLGPRCGHQQFVVTVFKVVFSIGDSWRAPLHIREAQNYRTCPNASSSSCIIKLHSGWNGRSTHFEPVENVQRPLQKPVGWGLPTTNTYSCHTLFRQFPNIDYSSF